MRVHADLLMEYGSIAVAEERDRTGGPDELLDKELICGGRCGGGDHSDYRD